MAVILILLLATFCTLTWADTVTYDFNITWVTANPDNAFPRPVIGINNKWPIPPIVANVGDRVIVNVQNQLGNQSTGLHFHGIYQNGTNSMDGSVGVTQCPVPPGQHFTYNFEVGYQCAVPNAANLIRSNNLAHTGIIPMNLASILMGFEVL